VDLRVVAATNADLGEAMAAGKFRQDLYFRLQMLEIRLPPLKERSEDIDPLVALFCQRLVAGKIKPNELFDESVLQAFRQYPWPGNVRELEGLVKRLTLMALHEGRGTLQMLPKQVARWAGRSGGVASSSSLAAHLQRAERERIVQVLTATGGNRTEAARILQISRNTLYKKMERYRIRIPV
jgi:two-component system response regulator HydG